jgi:hypothetical protein
MKTLVISALALTAMASAALATEAPKTTAADAPKATKAVPAPVGRMQLTDAQLGQVTAGGDNFFIPLIGQGGAGACQRCRSGGGDGYGAALLFPF